MYRFLSFIPLLPFSYHLSLWYNLVKYQHGNAEGDDKSEHRLTRLGISMQGRQELLVGLPDILLGADGGLVHFVDLVLLFHELAGEEAEELGEFDHFAFHHSVCFEVDVCMYVYIVSVCMYV